MLSGLAWDDKPDYLEMVKEILEEEMKVAELDVIQDQNEFISRYLREKDDLDFVVLDVMAEETEDTFVPVGFQFAQKILERDKKGIPVFMVTNHHNKLDFEKYKMPSRVILKFKSTHYNWMAHELIDELTARGLFHDSKKVFLIYGHEVRAEGINDDIRSFIQNDLNLEIVQVSSDDISTGILDDVIDKIRDCVAIIAVCTPDNEVSSVKCPGKPEYHPRGNVIMEIGMALSLYRGKERLIIMKFSGNRPDEMVSLPSNISNLTRVKFAREDLIEVKTGDRWQLNQTIKDKLKKRLIGLGAKIDS